LITNNRVNTGYDGHKTERSLGISDTGIESKCVYI